MDPIIAVIAVHGVADQKPSTSAREIANLLVDYPHGEQQRYSTFVEDEIRLAVDPIYPRQKVVAAQNFWGDTRASAEDDITGYGHEFMSEILSGREKADPPQIYPTVRLEGRRFVTDSPATIHVYELFWADLSRVGSGIARFFGELYQLLLHLPSLGKHSVSFAARENRSVVWKIYRWIERWAARLLALVIPILNLILLALMSLVLPAMVGPNMQITLAYLIPAVASVVVCALLLRDREVHAMIWLGVAPVAALLTVLAVSALFRWFDGLTVLAWEVWLLTVAAMLAILRSYGRRQKRALLLGAILFVVATGALAYWWYRILPSEARIAEVSLHMAAAILVAVAVVWFVWMIFVVIAAALALIAPLTVPLKDGRRKRARRAAWTGQFALALSGSMFAVVTTVLWSLLLRELERRLPAGEFSVYEGPVKWLNVSRTLAKVPESLMTLNVTFWFMIALLSLMFFVGATLWAVFPSILAEVKPPTTHPPERSRAGGIWLSRGIVLIGVAATALTLGIAVIFGLELLAAIRSNSPTQSPGWTEFASTLLGAASTIVLLMIGTKQWMAGALSALDVLLDVDNYMREHPRESAPRAQIAERYASLLRYLCRWRDPNGRGYKAIVIIAHSQGTVITADLLRFLRIEWRKPGTPWEPQLACILDDAASSRVPIYLFTMGSPLRQLYNLCFPHHYAWIDEDLPQYGALAKNAPIPDKTSPRPEEVDVKRWVNAYRSGDYVGRTIWLSHEYENVWCQCPAVEDAAHSRRERCIGRGAHTHYWDNTAGEIAAELHKLLGEAAQGV